MFHNLWVKIKRWGGDFWEWYWSEISDGLSIQWAITFLVVVAVVAWML